MSMLDDALPGDYTQRDRRPAARHRRARPSLPVRAARTLTAAATGARQALREAAVGSDTPAGGLSVIVCPCAHRRAS